MYSPKKLAKKTKLFEKEKVKKEMEQYKKSWKSQGNLPNPFKIVKEFIMEKGLKIYGGQALHEHLDKYDKGLYSKDEVPDYDVFSPDAWNHAKQLADKLYKIGFTYVEARSSILNDEHHQTFKVSVDMLFIFDITQAGCTRRQIGIKDCANCGISKDKKCISVFNHIPANDIKLYSINSPNKTFKKTYDYENDKSLYPNKLFVADPTWLKISMFREISEPLSNPGRLPKVSLRLDKFQKTFKFNHKLCNQKTYEHEMNNTFKPVLEHIAKFVKSRKLINIGATAFNFFMKGMKKHPGNINVSDYHVYSTNIVGDCNLLLSELKKKYPHIKFRQEIKKIYWKEIDTENCIINASHKSVKYNNLITFTHHDSCMPYVQANGIRYATIDRLKYILYRAVALKEVTNMTEEHPKNYECILSYLIKNEKLWRKKYPKSNKHKYKRFISKCDGIEINKIHKNLLKRWLEKNKTLKKTKFYIDKPSKGMITKVHPKATEELYFPYKPDETHRKKVIGRTRKRKGIVKTRRVYNAI